MNIEERIKELQEQKEQIYRELQALKHYGPKSGDVAYEYDAIGNDGRGKGYSLKVKVPYGRWYSISPKYKEANSKDAVRFINSLITDLEYVKGQILNGG